MYEIVIVVDRRWRAADTEGGLETWATANADQTSADLALDVMVSLPDGAVGGAPAGSQNDPAASGHAASARSARRPSSVAPRAATRPSHTSSDVSHAPAEPSTRPSTPSTTAKPVTLPRR